jgi:hypothetical protein
LINFAFCAIPFINVLILSLLGEGEAPKALKLETKHKLVLSAEIRRVTNVTETDVIAAVVVVVRAEVRERDEAETAARLLKRQTPSTVSTFPTPIDHTTESTETVDLLTPDTTDTTALLPNSTRGRLTLMLMPTVSKETHTTTDATLATTVDVMPPEGRKRDKAETPARLLKRQTPGTEMVQPGNLFYQLCLLCYPPY